MRGARAVVQRVKVPPRFEWPKPGSYSDNRREASQSKPPAVAAAKEVGQGAMRIAHILRQDFGKDDPAA